VPSGTRRATVRFVHGESAGARAEPRHSPALLERPHQYVTRLMGLIQASDPLIKSTNQRVLPNHTDALNAQQLELWPELQ